MLDGPKMTPIFCGLMSWQKLAVVLFVFGSYLVNGFRPGQHIPNYAGPYRVIIGRIGNTSEDYPSSTGKLWMQLRTTQVRGRQPQYGWGQSYASVPLSDDMKVELSLASRSNNQWKKNAFVFNFDRVCTNAKIHAQSLAKLMFGKELESCPGPVTGLREIRNHTFELVFPKFPIMPYGWYRFTFVVLRGKTILSAIEGDLHGVPKL